MIKEGFYIFFLPTYSCKFYWNNTEVAKVKMRKWFYFDEVTLETHYTNTDEKIHFYTLIAYLIKILPTKI